MIGYDSIEPKAPLSPAKVPPANAERTFHHQVREMAAGQGFTEVYNYSFVSEEQASAFGLNPADQVEVANPIAADQNLLRASLLPGIWRNIGDNARHFDAFRLFEIGNEIHKVARLPHFAAAIYAKDDGSRELARTEAGRRMPAPRRRSEGGRGAAGYEHPQRAAEVYHGGTRIGRLFEFHPRMVETRPRRAVLDLDLKVLEALQPPAARYQPLRRFPTSAVDISVAVPARTTIGEVQAGISRPPEVLSIEFLREFDLPDSKRSLSYRITAGASDHTLSSDEVSAIRNAALEALTRLGYESRS